MSDISPVQGTSKAQRVAAIKEARMETIAQQNTKESILNMVEDGRYNNPLAQKQKFEELKDRSKHKEPDETTQTEEPKPTSDADQAKILAKFYEKRNHEMDARKLLTLISQIKTTDDVDEMINKVIKQFSDPSLADEALDYLLETLPPGSATREKIREAQARLRARRGREILGGRNMGDISRSHPNLAAPNELRDLYREVTGNPRDAHTLFEELIQKFSYEKMREAIEFMLRSLGADLTAKGSSISHGQLHTLVSEARNMQAILGVYRFFKSRGRVIRQQFDSYELQTPKSLDFEKLAKVLVTLLKERYPSPEKILKLGAQLGIRQDIIAQIIIFTQYRDAMRGVSPRLFKNEKHRQEMLMTLIDTLADLEDELDEEEE